MQVRVKCVAVRAGCVAMRAGCMAVRADPCRSVQVRANACKSVQVHAEVCIRCMQRSQRRVLQVQNNMHGVQSLIPVILLMAQS